MFEPSLMDLYNFVPNDESEIIINPGQTVITDYMNETKSSWSKGNYYLGGMVLLNPNDKITETILASAQITDFYACNSAERASVCDAIGKYNDISMIINKYKNVMKKRVLDELNKTKLNNDVNSSIISFI